MTLFECGGNGEVIAPIRAKKMLRQNAYNSMVLEDVDTTGTYIDYTVPSSVSGTKFGFVLINPEGLHTLDFRKHTNATSLTVNVLKKDGSHTVETLALDSSGEVIISNPSQYALISAITSGDGTTVLFKIRAT